MELERNFIERRDFSSSRRGYDPDEVDRHLREIADAVAELRRSASAEQPSASLSGAAAERVRAIVEAAEASAAEIEQTARSEADALRAGAEADARSARERADAEAASRVEEIEAAARGILERAVAIDAELNTVLDGFRQSSAQLVADLRQAGGSIVSDLREGAESLGSELASIRRGVGDLRPEPAATAAEPASGATGVGQTVPHEPEPLIDEPAAADPDDAPLAAPDDTVEFDAGAEADAEDQPPVDGEQRATEDEAARLAALLAEDGSPGGTAAPAAGDDFDEGPASGGGGGGDDEGARLIALNMALNGTPREETAAYLSDNFDLSDQDALLDDVYSRAG